jgi:hypothetical protein
VTEQAFLKESKMRMNRGGVKVWAVRTSAIVLAAAIALGVLLAAGAAWAHHNMAAAFDFNQRFTVTGALAKIDWRNPHIQLSVDVKSDQGQVETWVFEGPDPGFFRRRNVISISKTQVNKIHFENAINKTVTTEASRARDGSRSGLIRMITLPDGTVVSLCPQNC